MKVERKVALVLCIVILFFANKNLRMKTIHPCGTSYPFSGMLSSFFRVFYRELRNFPIFRSAFIDAGGDGLFSGKKCMKYARKCIVRSAFTMYTALYP